MIRPAGEPVPPSPYGPWCKCGEYWTATIHTPLCPVCADKQRLERRAAQAAIGHTRFANIWQRKQGDAA